MSNTETELQAQARALEHEALFARLPGALHAAAILMDEPGEPGQGQSAEPVPVLSLAAHRQRAAYRVGYPTKGLRPTGS